MTKTTPVDIRLISKMTVDPQTQCWLWTGRLDPQGYARIIWAKSWFFVHRLSYELWKGKIPEGLQIDHLCRTPRCFNPDHLEAVTGLENTRRGINATKTHCKNGHLLDEANTYRRPNGHRMCRACNRAAVAALKVRKASRQ